MNDLIHDRYMHCKCKVDGHDINAVVKFDDEGVCIDLWVGEDVVESTWKLYDELPIELKEGR